MNTAETPTTPTPGDDEIVLVRPHHRLEYVFGRSVIWYERVPSSRQSRIATATTSTRGRSDIAEFNRRLLSEAIKGWRNLNDPTGAIPREWEPGDAPPPAVLADLIANLPGRIVGDLITRITDAAPEEAALGN
jgi:hypothetical protein